MVDVGVLMNDEAGTLEITDYGTQTIKLEATDDGTFHASTTANDGDEAITTTYDDGYDETAEAGITTGDSNVVGIVTADGTETTTKADVGIEATTLDGTWLGTSDN